MSTTTPRPAGDPLAGRRTVDVRAVPLPEGSAFVYSPRRRVLLVNSTADADEVEAAVAAYVEWSRPAVAG